ncbi:sigma-70 family RNA polymerase sigma factor [Paracoccus sp. SSK6]|uniref:sigma-70 family RNA polymerase sigma factor n=1 Tax=Paracoccus sp. SSK6 TaxID=3143131 RepID=UPI003219191F
MTYHPSKDEMSKLLRMVETQAADIQSVARDVRRADLVAEGQYALTMALKRYNPENGATAWTYTRKRVRGAMKDLVRKQRRPGMGKKNQNDAYVFNELSDDLPAEKAADPGVTHDAAKALQALLNPVQEVVIRERMQDCSFAEIGEKLGITRDKAIRIYEESLALMRTKLGVRTDI